MVRSPASSVRRSAESSSSTELASSVSALSAIFLLCFSMVFACAGMDRSVSRTKRLEAQSVRCLKRCHFRIRGAPTSRWLSPPRRRHNAVGATEDWQKAERMADDMDPTREMHAAGGAAERYKQTYPELTAREIDRLRRFGAIKQYPKGERLFEAGKITCGMFVVIKGHVCISQRDGLGRVTPVVEQGPGQFLAEVSQLSGKAALVDGYADEDVEVLAISAENLRRLMITEAELGERIMRALILRRVNLIQSGSAGAVLIGSPTSPNLIRLQGFLTRNGFPLHVLDPANDPEAAELIARAAPSPADLPLVICLDGTVMRNPTEVQLARALGMIKAPTTDILFDVAVVGSGPAGLATAVYGGSEGLSIVCLDSRAFGGQAGASARIENYFGFPTGISGQALTARAFVQAQKFGTEMVIPGEVKSLDCSRKDGVFAITVNDGVKLYARAIVIATGARYRRPKI